MNLGLWPEAVPFDPDDGAGSRELDAYLAGVTFPAAALVVAGRGMQASEWAPRAAIGLARSLEAAGRRVLLADLEFDAPVLPALLSESSVEGLADALLFGSSLERVTVQPAGQPFEFIAAGSDAPDPEELLAHPGWARLLSEVAATDTVFLGYTRFDAPGLDRLAGRIPGVVLLAEPGDAARIAAVLPDGIRIEAMIRPPTPTAAAGSWLLEPQVPAMEEPGAPPETRGEPGQPAQPALPGQPPAEPAEAGTSEPPGIPGLERTGEAAVRAAAGERVDSDFERIRLPKDEAREALIADLRARQRAAQARAGSGAEAEPVAADSAGARPAPVAGDLTVPPVAPRREPREPVKATRRRGGRWLAATLLLVLAAAAVWFFLLRDAGEGPGELVGQQAAVEVQPPPEPAGIPLGWSVAVEAHDRLPAAIRSVDSLAAADSTVGFYISPAVVGGDLWYRVLAGPLPDSVAAAAAMQRLVDAGLKRAAAIWDVRATPLAFLVGRFPLKPDAIGRMNELTQNGVPTYIVEVPYSRGVPWYHLYGGAYTSPPEADRMREILRGAGLPDTLVVRVGRIAS